MPEQWTADYWFAAEEEGYRLQHARTAVRLPDGYYKRAKKYIKDSGGGWNGNQGVLWRVREWGTELMKLDMPGDFHFALPPQSGKKTYVLGSPEHPFRIFAPDGKVMGTYDVWASYEGVLGNDPLYRACIDVVRATWDQKLLEKYSGKAGKPH
jgi:hypothetical protein